tara:strand:+ start:491 stop:673 length:183 start_codon:yes stop_codon:yes gene_type:complete
MNYMVFWLLVNVLSLATTVLLYGGDLFNRYAGAAAMVLLIQWVVMLASHTVHAIRRGVAS